MQRYINYRINGWLKVNRVLGECSQIRKRIGIAKFLKTNLELKRFFVNLSLLLFIKIYKLMATIFSRIIAGEIPCYKIAEDNQFFAFLDINPMSKGHTLVIPKIEEDYIFNLDDKILADFIFFAKKVSKALEKSVSCVRVGVAVIGLEVPHAHIHLIPINKESDMNFKNPKLKLSADEMAEIAQSIREKLEI